VAVCRAKNGKLFTNKNQVLAIWKENFEEHLNEGSESEQPDSIVAELLRNGEPSLVDALNELIQQAWTTKTLPRS
jgi:predicted SAM-dependent methyltransferase